MPSPKYPDWSLIGRDAEQIAKARAANELAQKVPAASQLPADAQLHAAIAELLGGSIVGAIDALSQTAGDARYQLKIPSVYDDGQVSGAVSVDWLLGTTHRLALVGNVTSFTIVNMPVGSALTLEINTGAGGFTFGGGDWSTVLWFGGAAPTVSQTASKIDRFRFDRTAAGLLGEVVGQGAVVPPPVQPPPPSGSGAYKVGDSLASAAVVRSTTATYRSQTGNVATAAINAARDAHYEGATRTLLLEKAATNLFGATEALDNATLWAPHKVTIVANALTAPDGQATAERTVEDNAGAGPHDVGEIRAAAAGLVADSAVYAVSVFANPTSRTWLAMMFEDKSGLTDSYALFNLSTASLGATVDPGILHRQVVAYANGWSRAAVAGNSGTGTVSADLFCTFAGQTGDTKAIYVGDGASGVGLWGAQLEAGPVATSYIPNASTSAVATRAADRVSWPWPGGFGDSTGFIRFIDRGVHRILQATPITIGPADMNNAVGFYIVVDDSGHFEAIYQRADNSVIGSVSTVAIADTDDVRLRWRLNDKGDGTCTVQLFVSLNGGAEVAAPESAPAPFDQPDAASRVWLNSWGDTSDGNHTVGAYVGWQIKPGNLALADIDNTTGAAVPSAPTNLRVTTAGTTNSLAWDAVAGAQSYNIYRKYEQGGYIDPSWVLITPDTPPTTASFQDVGLSAGATYHYQVTAVNGSGESVPSLAASATISATTSGTAPTAPTGLTATPITPTRIDLAWSNTASNATANEVHRSTTQGFTPDVAGGTTRVASLGPTVVSYSDQTVAASTTYFYRVVALNSAGNAPSPEASASTPAQPASSLAGRPNEPAGMTTVADRNFNTLTAFAGDTSGSQGWGTEDEWNSVSAGKLSTVSDASAPESPNTIARFAFLPHTQPTGTSYSSGVVSHLFAPQGAYKTVYVASWLRVSTNYVKNGDAGGTSNGQKFLDLFYDSSSTFRVWLSDFDVDESGVTHWGKPFQFRMTYIDHVINAGEIERVNNIADFKLTYGEWHRLEVLAVMSSAPNTADGVGRLWVDGTLLAEHTDLALLPAIQGGTSWNMVRHYLTWGGSGGTISQTFYIDIDHTYVSASTDRKV